jgi:hypothetical protein
MPVETRAITFNNAEVIEALTDFCAKTEREIPASGDKRLKFSNDGEVRVVVEVGQAATTVNFYENEVAVALIRFCNKKGIPVARRATKTLRIEQDSVALRLTIRTK